MQPHTRIRSTTSFLTRIVVNSILIAMTIFHHISPYLVFLMLFRDLAVLYVYRSAKKNLAQQEPIKPPTETITLLRCILIFVALLPLGEYETIIVFCVSATAVIVGIVTGIHTALFTINARDPKWLEGAGGKIGIPNWISIVRVSIVVIVPEIYSAQSFEAYSNIIAFGTIIVSVIGDKADGLLATALNQKTEAGKVLDPICDKFTFYPVLISMFIANSLTLPIPGYEIFAITIIAYILLALTVFRDLMFVGTFIRKSFRLGINSIIGAGLNIPSDGWDKWRFVFMSILLISFSAILAWPTTGFGQFASWIMLLDIPLCGIFSLATLLRGKKKLEELNLR